MEQAQAYAYSDESEVKVQRKPKKKPNFIARWFWNGLRHAASEERGDVETISMKERAMLSKQAIVGSSGAELNSDPIRFSIYPASGGFVVETRTPNRSGRNTIGPETSTKLHIIHKDSDLGQEIAKIITMEGLRA